MKPQPLSTIGALAIFAGFAVLLWLATHFALPAIQRGLGVEPVLAWFIAGGAVFTTLGVAAAVMYAREGHPFTWPAIRTRLRLRPLTAVDWLWVGGGLVVAGAAIGAIMTVGTLVTGAPLGVAPEWANVEPLGPGRYWILVAWLPLFTVNILGEELLWRGVLLPRQEAAIGRRAWLPHGLGHAVLFHLPFGLVMVLVATPIAIAIAYISSRRESTSAGIAVHALVNGPSFVALSLGLLP